MATAAKDAESQVAFANKLVQSEDKNATSKAHAGADAVGGGALDGEVK